MIGEALAFIRKEIINFLGLDDSEVITGHIYKLKETENASGVYISLINLEEETTLRNTPHHIKQNDKVYYKEPPIFLNLYLLFTFMFQGYDTSLLHMSKTIELFQSKRMFASENATPENPFPGALEKLVLEFCNLNFEQLNHMWSILGGTYFPSALYKVRLVKIQRDILVEGPEITTIQVDTRLT
jgi:hypothetical protein